MKTGLWVWPAEAKAQSKVLRKLAASQHLVAAMTALAKSKDGLSNSEVDDVIADNSEWMTLWVVRQLTSLGFVEFKVDLFGEPAKYQLTELGRNTLSRITGQPTQLKASTPPPVSKATPMTA
ncbi:MAG: hypothetical protein HY297_00185 [Thaumarchaeota archaeon]|nr:hypothetical protein [Nitrososphaerota archaeon]